MTAEVFTSAVLNPGDSFEIPNVLSIEAVSNFVGGSGTGLVRVDTNYKETRPGQHPVALSLLNAVNAASALIRSALTGYHQSDDVDALTILRAISDMDTEVQVLRDVLLREVQNIDHAADED